MRIGFMASYKRWAVPLQPSPSSSSALKQRSAALRSNETFELGRSPYHRILEGSEVHQDALKACICSSGKLQNAETISVYNETLKMNDMDFCDGFCDSSKPINITEDTSAYVTSLRSSSHLQFSLLMENIDRIEDSLAGSDLVRLERDILVHIGKLGALKLFHACLSRTLMAPNDVNPNPLLTKYFRDSAYFPIVKEEPTTIVRTGKKEQRKLRRMKASSKELKNIQHPKVSSPLTGLGGAKGSKTRRYVIARNEKEMAKGVKEIAELEKMRSKLEGEIGHSASYASWAQAAGIDQKTLQQRLQFGWYCRDRLIKSTHSLVVYLARNYRGLGISFDDLLQVGNMGVLRGAERFDHTRGYRFSTYARYWIRKSMLALIAHHARGIHTPVTMEKFIKRIQTARRTFYDGEGRYPQDEEVASLTGLSLEKVRLARKCSRVGISLDKELVNGWRTKFMEVIPDTSIEAPDEFITRMHMRKDIMELLDGLEPRERQVLLLRYGGEDGRCKSLGEVAKLCCVTKEWIRKVEKIAMAKVQRDDIRRELKFYLNP